MKTNKKICKRSISIPAWMKPLLKERAAQLDLTVSQYIRRLVTEEMSSNPLKVEGRNETA
jgi:hypothetical protein